MSLFDRFISILNRGLACVAGISLVTMVLVTVGEMVFRMFGKPMAGTVETIGWLAAVTTAFALGYTQIHQGHVSIDLFTRRLGPMLQVMVSMLVYLTSTVLFVIVTWLVMAVLVKFMTPLKSLFFQKYDLFISILSFTSSLYTKKDRKK